MRIHRRHLLEMIGVTAVMAGGPGRVPVLAKEGAANAPAKPADYTIRIGTGLVELAPDHIVSTTLYNGQFPGPLLRFKEGQQTVVDIYNDTDTPELVHWHGQMIPSDVDGAAEEGTPFVPAHGHAADRLPAEAGRFPLLSHPCCRRAPISTRHLYRPGRARLHRAEARARRLRPRGVPGDEGVRAVLQPRRRHGHGHARPATPIQALKRRGDRPTRRARGRPKAIEVGYELFSINGRMLGHGEPIRVKQGERVLFHVLNASATEIRSLALPGHIFRVVALDGNPVPTPAEVPVLWLGTAERISAVVEMNHPGVWVLGDLADDDRKRGMGIVVEYAGARASRNGSSRSHSAGTTRSFGKTDAAPAAPDETIELTIVKHNARAERLQPVDVNGEAFSMETMKPMYTVHEGRRYRLQIPQRQRRHPPAAPAPAQLRADAHRRQADRGRDQGRGDARRISGDRVRLRRRQSGLTLFHCHQQLHMDFGFMALFDYA